ncbi:MAG: hypothetical protein BroJett040_24200 [Oligoflexia bacterium]|nr:MAG: hypothetical protein BroJett040_24200 [Oligoflexia bacterium]
MKTIFLITLMTSSALALNEQDIQNLKGLGPQLSQTACQEDKYIRSCFNVDEPTCQSALMASYNSCFAMKMDQMAMDKKNHLGDWKKSLIDCAERDLDKKLAQKSKNIPSCKKGVQK